ncbi:chemotaxis protein CheB [Spirosoma fluminis]
MTKRDIIVIGASAGGVTALKEIVGRLPADFNVPIFVVQHVAPYSPSLLPQILTHSGPLNAVHPEDGDPIRPGVIYVAPPDHHILIEEQTILVKKGPKENRFRPSIDALFRSAAYTFGARVIGVVLTGLLNDGTSGMWSIKRLGGVSIVQQPEDALYPSMPENVLEFVEVEHVVPLVEIPSLLCKLTEEQASETPHLPMDELERMQTEVQIASQLNAFEKGILDMGELTPLTCPECHGALVSFKEGKLIRYRCHTGHAYTASALLSEVTKTVEDMFWGTIRGLEETIILLEQSAKVFAEAGDDEAANEFTRKAAETRERSRQLHTSILQQEQISEDLGIIKST